MDSHPEHDLIIEIFWRIAKENNKTEERIKYLLLVKKNQAINRRFWEILDSMLPNHSFTYVGCCAECGYFELH